MTQPTPDASIAVVPPLLVRCEQLQGIESLINKLGGNATALLHQSAIDPTALSNPERKIPFRSFDSLLENAAATLQCPHFGLLLAQQQGLLPLGIYGQMMRRSPNLQTAFHLADRHSGLHQYSLSWQLSVEGSFAQIRFHYVQPQHAPVVQHRLFSIARVFISLRALIGNGWRASSVTFIHASPKKSAGYQNLFHSPVDFSQPFDGLTFPASDLQRPFQESDSELLALLKQHDAAMKIRYQSTNDIVSSVRKMIQQTLGTSSCNIESVATLLQLPSKTLHRRLRIQGSTFKQLLNEIRHDTAIWYLQRSQLPLTQLSEILGYSELSAFSRAFKGQCGLAPVLWRQEHTH